MKFENGKLRNWDKKQLASRKKKLIFNIQSQRLSIKVLLYRFLSLQSLQKA